jgi:VCBS repeat-containing protein
LIHTPGEAFESRDSVAVIPVQPDTAAVTIPDAHLLFTEFKRKGSDLVLTGDDGHKIPVPDYFRHEKQPDLVSPEGALLSASLVELLSGSATPGQYAQAAAPVARQPIGRVETVSVSATVTRNGVAVDLNVGDLVFQGDVVQPRSDSTLGIGFADGSAFSLKENARMPLNEFVYDLNGTSNSALFSLNQGAFTFAAGKVAQSGGLRIDTPVARIRGTSQDRGIGILTLAALTFSVVDEVQAASWPDAFLDDDTVTYKDLPHGTFEITTRDGRVIVADDPGETIVVDPQGSVTRIPNSSSRMAELQGAQQAALATLSQGMGQQGAAPGGSSTPTFNIPLQLQSINFSLPQNHDPAPLPATITTPANPGIIDVPVFNFKPPPVTPPTPVPVLAADASGEHGITEVLNTTGSSKLDTAPSGVLTFTDLNVSKVSASLASITWSGGGATLPSGLSTVLASALTTSVSTDGSTGFAGSIATAFSAADNNFDFLAAGETLTIVYNVTVTGNNGVSLTQPVTIIVTGSDDVPMLAADASGPHAITKVANTTSSTSPDTSFGTLTFTDVDLNDHHTVSASPPTFAWSGGALTAAQQATLAAASTLTLSETDSTGSGAGSIAFSYSAADKTFNFLAVGQTLTITYDVTVTDNQGASSTRPVTITVIGTNEAPVITSAAQTGAIIGDTNIDDSGNLNVGGTITFTDVNLPDTHTVTFTAGRNDYVGTFSLDPITQDSTNGQTGSVVWHFSVSDQVEDSLAAGQTLTQTYTVKVADNNGGFTTQDVTITITGTNDAPVITSGAAAVAVSEEGLSNGVPDTLPAGLDTTNSTTASGTITASDVDGDALTMTLGVPSTSLTSGGIAIAWTLQDDDHTLVGKAGATTIIAATITDAGAYNVTLSGPIDHPVAGQEDDTTVTVPVNVSDGHTTTPTTFSVSIEDDSPTAAPVEVSVDTNSMTNVMLILDVSGSMDSSSGLDGLSRLDAAKAAIDDLLDQYDSHGDVRVQIVKFSTGASQVGTDWMSVADAKAAIAGLSAGGSTFYDDALTTAMNIFGDAGKLSGSGTQNVSYFLSDGEPTASHEVQTSQQTSWESFLTTNNIVSFALGISDSPTTADLDPIAFDPASGTQLADTPIIVTDLDQLTDTLVFTASSVSGSVLSGANSFGADGGHVQSITVDGVTYTFNPAANGGAGGITVNGDGSFSYDGTTKTLTVDTSGGELAMVMTTGAFTFQPPTDFSSESVGFVLVDGDGDTASSTLELTANTLPAGVAGSPINLGLSNPAGHVGPVTVAIAGVPAGWTLSGGADNGHAGWTIQASSVSALTITSPHHYAGAMAFKVTMSWTNADHSGGFASITDNVEVFTPGAPIVAWSGDDHLTGSSGPNLFVFAQPIGHDTIYSFDASEDQIDLIGYAGFTNFNDVQRHLAEDNAGNTMIGLGGGQSIALLGVAASSLTASNFVFDKTPVLNNAGTMTIGDGALLPLAGIINNAGTIELDSAGHDTHLQLIQYGIALQGGGQLILSDSGQNFISGTIPSVTLTNVDDTISGAGQLGAGRMTLVNEGTIIATGSHALVIDTGANVVTNSGTLEATESGGLIVNSDVANSGLIWAHGGNITINRAVSGSGSAMIDGTATLGFGAASPVHITFAADAAGTLTLKDAADFTRTISGFSSNDQIDLTNINYSIASVSDATYSSSTNITTLVITDGTSTDAIKLVGNYTINTAWHFSGDGHGGTLLTDSLPGGSADLAQTVTAALTGQDGTADQFTFQSDSQSTLAASSTLTASEENASATDPTTLDPTSSASSDHQPTGTTTMDGSAVNGLASNVATTSQPATADSTNTGQQAGATTQTALASPAATGPNGSDTFVFAANFGHETIANFHPDTDVIEIDHTVFADFQALLAATHDDGNGNAVIAANPNDTITVKNVTVAQLVQHQSDFHFT